MEMLGRWVTKFTPGPSNGDGANIRVPAERINGTILKPGEEFNFIQLVLPITDPPYQLGGVLRNGRIVVDGVLGGGMCSTSTTLFNAAMRAGLRVTERYAHALYINRYPVGLDATVIGTPTRGRNVRFVNDTARPLLIKAWGKQRKVIFEIWGVPDGRTVELSEPRVENLREAKDWIEYTDELEPGERRRVQERYDAFESWVTRTVRNSSGKVIHEDTFSSKYRLLDGIIEVGRYPDDPPAGTRIPADEYVKPKKD